MMRPQEMVAVGPPITLMLAAGLATQPHAIIAAAIHCYLNIFPRKHPPLLQYYSNQKSVSPKQFRSLIAVLLFVRNILFDPVIII